MSSVRRNEISYYSDITKFIEAQIMSNFRAKNININVYWKIGEFTKSLYELVLEHPSECSCLKNFINNTPALNLDIFGVVTDGRKFQIIILEVKLKNAVGLSEWSQLLGYSVVSDARYGILLNIDAGASQRLTDILCRKLDASRIVRKSQSGCKVEHLLGFMQWNSLTKNFEYSNLGRLRSISELSDMLLKDFCI